MPTYLPLDLVLAIVRLAATRERRDEDSPAHRQRVAPLCLVCKAFKDAVEPLLWKSLVVEQMEQLHKFAGRSGRNTHLLDQVEEFRGGGTTGRRPGSIMKVLRRRRLSCAFTCRTCEPTGRGRSAGAWFR